MDFQATLSIEHHARTALSHHFLEPSLCAAGPLGLPVQRASSVATATGSQPAASSASAAGLFAAPADAGPALRAGKCPDAASQQLLQQPAVWLTRGPGIC